MPLASPSLGAPAGVLLPGASPAAAPARVVGVFLAPLGEQALVALPPAACAEGLKLRVASSKQAADGTQEAVDVRVVRVPAAALRVPAGEPWRAGVPTGAVGLEHPPSARDLARRYYALEDADAPLLETAVDEGWANGPAETAKALAETANGPPPGALRTLAGKVALVTGSSSGVGAAVVQRLAAAGCDVVVNFSRSRAPAEQVAEACRAHGVRALLYQADVSSDEGCEALVRATVADFGRVDFLVNNAGTTKFVAHEDLEGLSPDDFLRIYDVNAVGAWRLIRLCAPHMKRQGAGRVVNVASIAGVYHTTGSCVAYVMSKAALLALTTCMAKALGPEIVVNAVCPGFIEGEWLKQGMGEEVYDYVRGKLVEKNPLRAVAKPEDVAASVHMLLEHSVQVTGQSIVCDAGMGLLRGPIV